MLETDVIQVLHTKYNKIQKQNYILSGVIILSIVSNILSTSLAFDRNDRYYFVTAGETNTDIFIDKYGPSKGLLKRQARYLVNLVYNIHPGMMDTNIEEIMPYISQQGYRATEEFLIAKKQKYLKEGLSTSFQIKVTKVNREERTVDIEGILTYYLKDNKVRSVPKKIHLKFFQGDNGFTFLQEIKELES